MPVLVTSTWVPVPEGSSSAVEEHSMGEMESEQNTLVHPLLVAPAEITVRTYQTLQGTAPTPPVSGSEGLSAIGDQGAREDYEIGINRLREWSTRVSRPARFTLLRNWEGYVLDVTDDSFLARLVDISGNNEGDEEAEIFLSEVVEDDRPLVEEGAVFYWSLGYRDEPNGMRIRVSGVRFRRLPSDTDLELLRARARAEETVERLDWHS